MFNYIAPLAVPIAFLLIGAFAKKLVRGSGWLASDFYLGVELTLAALASSLVFLLELSSQSSLQSIQEKALVSAFYIITNFFLLFYVMTIHQDWKQRPHNLRGQHFWMGGVSNLIGASLLAGFVIVVKGVN